MPARREKRPRRRRGLKVAAAVLGILAIVAIVERDWTGAQLRAIAVLSTTEQLPVLAWTVRAVTSEPRIEETTVGGAPSTVVRPGTGNGPWPAVVFVNGATRRGRHHPKVQRLAEGLARSGFLVVVPDLPGLRLGAITPATAQATIRAARATADRDDVRNGKIALNGVSVGATLALLAAESPVLKGRVTIVGGQAPWVDLEKAIRLAFTGEYEGEPYEIDPYVRLAMARSLATWANSPLLERLEAVDDMDPRPLAALSGTGKDPLELFLRNRSGDRFNDLYNRLPEQVRLNVRLLSPIHNAERLDMPVELATAPHDKYFPPAESFALARAAPDVRVTVTSTLDHAVPKLSLGDIGDLGRFDGFMVRYLRTAADDD